MSYYMEKWKNPSKLNKDIDIIGKIGSTFDKNLGIFSGFASILGFIFALTPTVLILWKSQNQPIDYNLLFTNLTVSILLLIIALIGLNIYYSSRIKRAYELIVNAETLQEQLDRSRVIIRNNAKIIHNILHYYRYMLVLFTDANKKFGKKENIPEKEDILKILNDFTKFLMLFLDNVKFHMDTLTEDDCSVCIKITKDMNGDKKIKTFFRDSSSVRERKKNDFVQRNKPFTYSVNENTAFKVILDSKDKRKVYISNNLKQDEAEDRYNNKNMLYKNYYNACAVVPISIIPEKKKMSDKIVLGFLCADNNSGNFASKPVVDFLSGLGDVLANLFIEFSEFAKNCEEQGGIEHDRLEQFNNWG